MIIQAISELGVTEFKCDSLGTKESFEATYKSLSSDNPDITWEQVSAKITELQSAFDSQEYARNRQAEYPSVGDQLDMLMKDMKNGTTTHQESCEAVKAKYPKPS